MDKKDIEAHIDGKLALLCIDHYDGGATKPMSQKELADELGISKGKLKLIEMEIYEKLRKNPSAWEAVSMMYRTPPVVE
jgi:hypothetical protein